VPDRYTTDDEGHLLKVIRERC